MRVFTTYFWFCFLLFCVNQFIEKLGVIIPFVHSYLDDFLSAGIVLGFALAIQQQLTFRNKMYIFTFWHVLFYVLWYSLLFELWFPTFDSRHYADAYDVVAYAAGGFCFYQLGNKPVKSLIRFRKKLTS